MALNYITFNQDHNFLAVGAYCYTLVAQDSLLLMSC